MLVHDLLCSKGGIAAAAGPVKEAILRHKTRLKADYVKAQLAKKEESKGMRFQFLLNCRFCSALGKS